MQRGGAVEQDRVALGDFGQNIPDLGGLAINHLLGRAHGVAIAQLLEAADDERLKHGERHLLGQAALAELEVRTDDDDRAAGVIDALAEQVLAETAALALEHIAEGFERAVAGTGDGAAVATIVKERVNGLLEHALFIANDDLGGLEQEEVFEAVVAVDDATIEVVEVGGGETAAFQRYQRAQVRRDDRKHRLNHPFGTRFGRGKPLGDLETLGKLLAVLLGTGSRQLLFQDLGQSG